MVHRMDERSQASDHYDLPSECNYGHSARDSPAFHSSSDYIGSCDSGFDQGIFLRVSHYPPTLKNVSAPPSPLEIMTLRVERLEAQVSELSARLSLLCSQHPSISPPFAQNHDSIHFVFPHHSPSAKASIENCNPISQSRARSDNLASERPIPSQSTPLPISQFRSPLPEIKLITFDGNPKEWRDFQSTFEVVIHMSDASDIEKMLYLRQSLKGEALDAISMFENEDYLKAWKQINLAYGNKSYLTDRLVRELESLPPPSLSPHSQRHCLHRVRGLVSMIPTCANSSDPFLRSLICRKFSMQIQEKIVEKKCDDHASDSWPIDHLFSLIDKEITLLERKQFLLDLPIATPIPVLTIHSTLPPSPSLSPEPPHHTPHKPRTSPPIYCSFCDHSDHKSRDCSRIPSIQARRNFIWENRLCFNCRSPYHMSSSCKKPPCPNCRKRHDLSICPVVNSRILPSSSSVIPPTLPNGCTNGHCV